LNVPVPDPDKVRAALLDAAKDYAHRFADVARFLEATGWRQRVKGSHHIFIRPGIPVLLNLQPEKDGKAKAYQSRQVRAVLTKFKL
jgi:predicted RNA binding protein YcfA (HicA-like mRNA interferase family)